MAQSSRIAGIVTDDAGNALAGAHIRLVGSEETHESRTVTDSEGSFSIAAGNVARLEVSYLGFVTQTFVLRADGGKRHTLRLEPDVASLEQVVVTATRTPKALKDAPVVTRLITSKDIEKVDATNVQDLLTEELPGLEFGYAMSQDTYLQMNGFGGNAVLFLVDGERMAGETMDNVDYSRLNMEDVGRIEVVKGAASALYGANAVAGVVNIISRESTEPFTAKLSTRYSHENRGWRHGGSVSFNAGKWNSHTSAQRTSAETVRLASPFDTRSLVHEAYGGTTLNIKERLTLRATESLKLTARGSYFKRVSYRTTYDDHYTDYAAGIRAVLTPSEAQHAELSYSYDQYDKTRYEAGIRTDKHDYSNRQHVAHGLYSRMFGANTLTVGADYMNDYLTTYQFVGNAARTQNSCDVFAQFDYTPTERLNLVGSVRHDYFSASDNSAVTARLALMLKWSAMSVRLNYSGGFRAPTMKEMHMNFEVPGVLMIYGNEDLKPERSNNVNLALEHSGRVSDTWAKGQYSVTLTAYYNRYDRRIATIDYDGGTPMPDDDGVRYCNEEGVDVTGMDISANYRTAMGLGIKLNYSLLHTNGTTVESQFSQPRPHTATWRVDYDRQFCSAYGLNVALSGRYLSKPDTDNAEYDGAYQMWKLSIQNRIWRGVNVNLTVENLMDYRPEIYYWNSARTTGRSWSLGVTVDLDKMF